MSEDAMNFEKQNVSSPIATGGSGTFYEQHVGACYLVVLVVGGVPPVLTDCVLVEVALQGEHLGWNTDDIVLTGETGAGSRRRLAIQVKRAFTISKSDDDCVKAFKDFWLDFTHAGFFVEGSDALALCVQAGGGDSAVVRIRSLCDIARASKDTDDFNHRLATEGFTSAAVKKAAGVVKEIVQEMSEVEFSDDRFWRFLKSLHAFTLDLNTSTGQIESLLRTLLSLAATGQDKAGEAQLTWNELLVLAGRGMPQAQTFTRSALPETLQKRHTKLGASAANALAKAKEHSQTTLRGIRTLLGKDISLARRDVIGSLLDAMSQTPLVLVTGPAGSGKSALAKLAIEQVQGNSAVLAFRAEEFAVAHLDQALQQAQIPANSEMLQGLLAAQARKVLLVESVERLLEASTRDAFMDLLLMCAGDGTWQVVLTCRDYSVDIVRSSFLDHLGISTQIIRVPPLSDSEIDEVVKSVPNLARPASHPFLRALFRTPYILDKAVRMSWPEGGTLPGDEQAFRRKFWSEIIRRDDQAQSALPNRRQTTFIELCLRRAQVLEPFASTEGLDRQALEVLRKDGFVEFSPSSDSVAAPTHDVLEDWAVVEWIAGRFAVLRSDGPKFAAELGTFPAVRRGYRKWLGEFLAMHPADADNFVMRVVADDSLPAHFRDDSLVAVLTSSAAGDFFSRNRSLLTANSGSLLRRVIHLVRVACKTTPHWAKGVVVPTWFIPFGPAWPAALKIVREELPLFVPSTIGLVVGLLSDWASSIAWWAPVPDGASDAVAIAHALLPHVDSHSSRDLRKSVLSVIAKAPSGDLAEFARLADRAAKADRHDHAAEELGQLLLTGLDSPFACRDAPDDVIRVADAKLFLRDDERSRDYHHAIEIESSFGLRNFPTEFFPASSLQGPFLPLLRSHPPKGLAFIIRLLNRACEAYASPAINRRLEAPFEVKLKLPDGTEKSYWCNGRLWAIYRGVSVAPHGLECALMALESFLLELCKNEKANVEDWLAHILRESNNAALVAVVASIATAYPGRAGKVAVSVLTSKDLIDLDRSRSVVEMHGRFKIPLPSAQQRIFEEERRQADTLPHRKAHLETLALRLQFTSLRTDVEALLDRYKAALPPIESQAEEDKLWRLALNRMDLRSFRAQEEIPEGLAGLAGDVANEEKERKIYFVQGPLEPDLQAIVDDKAPGHKRFDEVASLFVWGRKAFDHEPNSGDHWKEKLEAARKLSGDSARPSEQWLADAPVFVAAVCVRDHLQELTTSERDWCIELLVSAVRRDADTTDLNAQFAGSPFGEAGAAVSVLPIVLSSDADEPTKARVLDGLALALTHSVSKVPVDAALGIGRHLGHAKLELALGLVRLIVLQATRLAELDAVERKQRPYLERRRYDELRQQARQELRASRPWGTPCTVAELDAIHLREWSGNEAYKALMPLLLNCPDHLLARQAFLAVAAFLAASWTDKEER